MDEVKVLLIDDDKSEYLIIKKYLSMVKSKNYIIHWQYSLDRINSCLSDFDICIIDYSLPNVDVLGFIKEHHQKLPHLSIILISGINDDQISAKAIKMGACAYLSKRTVNNEILEHTLNRVVEEKQNKIASVKSQQNALNLAYIDQLTGLANRRAFEKKITSLNSSSEVHRVALLLLDIDNFKSINDSYGHLVGDQLLIKFSNRLSDNIREKDFIARLGGDEFVILIETNSSKAEISSIAEKIINVINRNFILDDIEISSGVSIGITTCDDKSIDLKSILKEADMALYEAKDSGKNTYQIFSKKILNAYHEKKLIIDEIGRSLRDHKFHLEYQTIISKGDGKLVAIEALLRSENIYINELSTEKIIAMSEDAGLMPKIGEWVLNQACQDYLKIRASINIDISLAINFSSSQLSSANCISFLCNTIKRYNIEPNKIMLEVTEVSLFNKVNTQVINGLSQRGFTIVLDDLGRHYLSLKQLQSLPISMIKIDQKFLQNLSEDNKNLINIFADIAHHLNLKIVLEGIGQKEAFELFSPTNAQYAQGFYIDKPQPLKKLIKLIQQKYSRFS